MVDEQVLFQSNILIVDDNLTNIALLEEILDMEGYENITSTTDPRIVPDLYKNESYDLLLLDIRMPHMNGIELMEILHSEVQDDYLPILVLTAQTDLETRQQALAVGAKDFISKPFNLWEVALRIKNMLVTRHYFKQQVKRGDILEAEVRQRTKDIRETQLEIVRRLGRAGEFRDNETGAHVIRMSKVCELIARSLGLDEGTCEIILNASPMHDVGKIAIPDAILLKEGPLTDEEWEIMKSHTTVGREIIGDHSSDIIMMASQMALNHHEKWDGTGYPHGLKGEDIPLVARIATISDVFDALTSARPYKGAWSVEKAIKAIEEGSGTHFDPEIVKVFMENIEEILMLRKQFPD